MDDEEIVFPQQIVVDDIRYELAGLQDSDNGYKGVYRGTRVLRPYIEGEDTDYQGHDKELTLTYMEARDKMDRVLKVTGEDCFMHDGTHVVDLVVATKRGEYRLGVLFSELEMWTFEPHETTNGGTLND